MVTSIGGMPPPQPNSTSSYISLTSTDGVGAKLIALSAEIKAVRADAQVRGQIISVRDDGVVRIRTDQGDIDAQLPPRVRADVGQIVDVAIPKGSPPTTAQISPAQNREQPTADTTTGPRENAQPPQKTNEGGNTSSDPSRSVPRTVTPPESSGRPIKEIAQTPRPDANIPRVPSPGQPVVLRPVTAVEARQIIQNTSQTMIRQMMSSIPVQLLLVSSGTISLRSNSAVQPTSGLSESFIPVIPNQPAPIFKNVATSSPEDLIPSFRSISPVIAKDSTGAFFINIDPSKQIVDPTSLQSIKSTPSSALALKSLLAGMVDTAQGQLVRITAPVLADYRGGMPVFDVPEQILTTAGFTATTQPFTVTGHTAQGHAILQSMTPPPSPAMPTAPLLSDAKIDLAQTPASQLNLIGQDAKSNILQPQALSARTASPLPPNAQPPALFVMQVDAVDLPVGSVITLRPLNMMAAPLSSSAPTSLLSSPPLPFKGISLPFLDDLMELVRSLPPEIAIDLFGKAGRPIIPQAQGTTPQNLGAAALFFLAAVRAGDVNGWLGERAVDTLRRIGKGGLLEKLADGFSSLRRTQETGQNAEWRSYAMPMQIQQEIMPLRLHVRQEGHHGKDKQDGHAARFMIEVDFDNMGMVQLDLLYRPRTLDTIVRTEIPLSRAMMAEMSARYIRAMEGVDHTGNLIFQHGPDHWVTVDAGRDDHLKVLA